MSGRRMRPRPLVTSVAVLLASCSGGSDGPADGGPDGGLIEDLTAVESASNRLGYTIEWRTARPLPTVLDVDCADLGAWTLDEPVTSRADHEAFVMGLAGGARCELTARAVDGGETVDSDSVTLDVAEPPSFLPDIELTVADDTGAAEPGWTLLNLHNRFRGVPYTVAIVDERARIRWYYQASTDETGADTPVVRLDGGVAFGGRNVETTVIDWRGHVRWQGPAGHHEVEPTGEPGHLYYLDWSRCPELADELGALIVEVDWLADATVWQWDLCEHYTPDPSFPDWAHVNTAAPFGDEDALIVSSRNQNSIMKVDRSSGDIVWSMGFDGRPEDGFRGDFAMAVEDRFYQQHDPNVTDDGTIVLFDNGHATLRPFSRAIEIDYDHDPGGESTASVVWEYRHDPDLYTPIWGDADRLPGGTTLITFGERQESQRTTIVEVSPAAEPIWEIQMPPEWGTYQSQRVGKPRGFVVTPGG